MKITLKKIKEIESNSEEELLNKVANESNGHCNY